MVTSETKNQSPIGDDAETSHRKALIYPRLKSNEAVLLPFGNLAESLGGGRIRIDNPQGFGVVRNLGIARLEPVH